MQYQYGVEIRREADAFAIYVRDLPEVISAGETLDEALELAADAIAVAVAARMEFDMDVPEPSPLRDGEHAVPVPSQIAVKAAVYTAWKRAGISKIELARRMGRSENEARRILKPNYATRLEQMDEAARALGTRLVIGREGP